MSGTLTHPLAQQEGHRRDQICRVSGDLPVLDIRAQRLRHLTRWRVYNKRHIAFTALESGRHLPAGFRRDFERLALLIVLNSPRRLVKHYAVSSSGWLRSLRGSRPLW
ncbi:hypothetical protein PC119_g17891 [Phytophthora cactorum]|nr:hypothetical protein PC119_g17891 [Phytophthora cactorum]